MKPYYEHAGITIYHGDCREILPALESVTTVVVDPPYTFGLQSAQKNGGWGDLMNNALFYATLLREFRRLSSGATWIFNSWRSFPVLAKAAFEAEWPIESLLVWDKGPEVGMGGLKGLRSQYELAALFASPSFQIADRSAKDILNVPWGGSWPREHHAAQKPVPLLEQLLRWSGDGITLDSFMGSGTTLVAAKNLGRKAIGIEIEERYCEIAAKRLAQEVMQFDEVTS